MLRKKKSHSLSEQFVGASGHSDVPHVQHDPVAEMSSNASSAGSGSLCTGDSDSTHVMSNVSPVVSESLCTGDSDSTHVMSNVSPAGSALQKEMVILTLLRLSQLQLNDIM